jgi:hypothetical protein
MQLEDAVRVRQEIASFLRMETVRRRKRWMRVAIGISTSPSATGMKIAVRARSKKDLDRAFGNGAGEKIREMASAELEIEITGQIVAGPPLDTVPPNRNLRIGASVGHTNITAGTLGFFARRISDGTLGFVSNNHVLAECDHGEEGDLILHPGRYDGGVAPKDVVATLAGTYPKLQDDRPVVDAAFAVLRKNIDYDALTITPTVRLNPSLIPPLYRQTTVLKTGRSTGTTYGRITAFHLQNLDIDYPALGTVFLDRQIEVRTKDGGQFSSGGDSGSLVVTPDGHPIGLLFSGAGNFSYMNPIEEVLHDLRVTFVA